MSGRVGAVEKHEKPQTTPGAGSARSPAPPAAKEETPAELESDIEAIRENLGDLISELDERRHRLNPVRIARANPMAVALAGLALVGLCAGGIAWRMARARRERGLATGIDRLRRAVGGAVGGSAPRARPALPSVTVKVLTAAGTAVAAVAARRLTEAAFARARAGSRANAAARRSS